MRTVLARLIALGVIGTLAGCSGSGSNPVPFSGGINGAGGAQGVNSGSAAGGTGATSNTANSTSTRSGTGSASGVSYTFAPGTLGWQYTANFPSGGATGFTVTNSATTGATSATLAQSLSPFAGVAAIPLPTAATAGGAPPAVLQYGQLTFTAGTVTGTTTPAFQISGVTPVGDHTTVNLAVVNQATGAWIVPVTACTITGTTINCPAATLAGGYTSATPLNFAIYTS
ncbi:MAG: hypothetical protein JO101_11900 [Candidatus Eremiobacteraeota bacterium]|nr:hypothetical protein [Candidatus Eremiobacteraeota bacterium]MBV8356018.1 hypothetical protein [Candidatus Eremiobacteraeota bacterium]